MYLFLFGDWKWCISLPNLIILSTIIVFPLSCIFHMFYGIIQLMYLYSFIALKYKTCIKMNNLKSFRLRTLQTQNPDSQYDQTPSMCICKISMMSTDISGKQTSVYAINTFSVQWVELKGTTFDIKNHGADIAYYRVSPNRENVVRASHSRQTLNFSVSEMIVPLT